MRNKVVEKQNNVFINLYIVKPKFPRKKIALIISYGWLNEKKEFFSLLLCFLFRKGGLICKACLLHNGIFHIPLY